MGVALIETILSLTWNRFYFTIGVPILRIDLQAFSPGAPVPTSAALEVRVAESRFPPMVFRQLASDSYGFRERAWGGFLRFSYTPVMHGLLQFDKLGARVRFTGLLNWFVVVFTAVFVLPFTLRWPVPLAALAIFPL